MLRLIVVFVTLLLPLFASKYNSTLLQIHARVLPSIVLMDRNIESKVPTKELKIAVFYEKEDLFEAQKFATILESVEANKIGNYSIKPVLITEENQLNSEFIAVYILSAIAPAKVADHATDLKIISFSYKVEYVDLGVMASLVVGKQAVPYINLSTIKRSEILFSPALLSISKRAE